MKTNGQCRFPNKELLMSASLALPSLGRVLCDALRISILIFLLGKWLVKAVRRAPTEERDVISATTPRMVGTSLSVEA
jgi:hypothetical protein